MPGGNLQRTLDGYAAFARGDLEALLELMDEDVVWMPAILPLLGTEMIRGRRRLELFFTRDIQEGFADFQAVAAAAEELGDDLVLVESHYSATGRASGAPVVFVAHSLIRFRGDKLIEYRDHDTRAEALATAGVADRDPAPPAPG